MVSRGGGICCRSSEAVGDNGAELFEKRLVLFIEAVSAMMGRAVGMAVAVAVRSSTRAAAAVHADAHRRGSARRWWDAHAVVGGRRRRWGRLIRDEGDGSATMGNTASPPAPAMANSYPRE